MRPLFTIHAGEYLAGLHIQQRFPKFNIWVPAKEADIDLLVTDRENRRAVSLQVKYGKEFPARKISQSAGKTSVPELVQTELQEIGRIPG